MCNGCPFFGQEGKGYVGRNISKDDGEKDAQDGLFAFHVFRSKLLSAFSEMH